MKTIKNSSVIILLLISASIDAPMTYSQDTLRINIYRSAQPISLDYTNHYLAYSGYKWMPGHSVVKGTDTFWVRGNWVRPHNYEYLWTPKVIVLHPGHRHRFPYITLYTGVNYGYGYGDRSFSNGKWEDGISFSF
jgi:hypothetical protein